MRPVLAAPLSPEELLVLMADGCSASPNALMGLDRHGPKAALGGGSPSHRGGGWGIAASLKRLRFHFLFNDFPAASPF